MNTKDRIIPSVSGTVSHSIAPIVPITRKNMTKAIAPDMVRKCFRLILMTDTFLPGIAPDPACPS